MEIVKDQIYKANQSSLIIQATGKTRIGHYHTFEGVVLFSVVPGWIKEKFSDFKVENFHLIEIEEYEKIVLKKEKSDLRKLILKKLDSILEDETSASEICFLQFQDYINSL